MMMDTVVTEAEGEDEGAVHHQHHTRRPPVDNSGDPKPCSEDLESEPAAASSSPIAEFFDDPGSEKDGIKGFMCSYCGKKFARRQTLEQHERIHTGEKPFQCSECNKCFRQQSALRVHSKGHTGDRAFECFVCSKRFYRSADLKAHLGIHTGVRAHNCPMCSKGFGRSSDLRRHMQTHEAEPTLVSVDRTPHECSHCGKKFTRRAQLEVHTRVHTREKPYQCTLCGESFRWKQNFQAHQRNHTCEKAYPCPDCDKRFASLEALEKHQILFHSVLQKTRRYQGSYVENGRHQCLQCGKSFNQAKDLAVHQRIHTGEKPYECSQCDKRFRQIGHLKEHQRVHSGEKPFQCPVCYKCFPYSQSMKKHMRVIHGAHPGNMTEGNFSLMDDVEEVQIGSAPSSPSSKLSDEPGASDELTYHIKSEEQCFPLTEDVDNAFCSINSDLSDEDGGSNELGEVQHIKVEDTSQSFMEDTNESSPPASPLPKYSGVFDECHKSWRIKTEEKNFPLEEDVREVNVCSAPSSPVTDFTEGCAGFHEHARRVKSEEECVTIMDDVLRVKSGSTPVGAL